MQKCLAQDFKTTTGGSLAVLSESKMKYRSECVHCLFNILREGKCIKLYPVNGLFLQEA